MRTLHLISPLLASLFLAACSSSVDPVGAGGGSTGGSGSSSSSGCDPAACPPAAPQSVPHAVAIDAVGNVFVVGERNVVGHIDPANDAVFYVSKRDPSGKELWSRLYGQGARRNQYRLTAAVDAQGNLVVAGEFNGTGDFDGATLTPLGSGDAFAILLDPEGHRIWSRTFGTSELVLMSGVDGPDYQGPVETGASSVTFDAAGDVVLAGDFHEHVDFGNGALDAAKGSNFVVVLGHADGKSLASRQIADSWFPIVAADPGGAIVIASTYEPVGGSGGVLVTKLDSMLAEVWKKSFLAGGLAGPSAVKVDSSGNLVVAGSFTETMIDFGGGPLTSGASFDVFVAGLSPSGDARWSEAISAGGPGNIRNPRLAVGAGGQAVIAADCEGQLSVGGMSVMTKSGQDICLVRFDIDGKPLTTGLYSGPSDDSLQAMALTPQGGAVVVGFSSNENGQNVQAFDALIP